ncbi:hypothetical protein VN97_g11520 [Penicillium thymicola]|uniref:Uncharacterized protein n=1 Tax=Penicillium thymicola TaxID=293382 RepID=A0AAI9X3B0_PENTH|nr:hypothetical protein VN97_g11520 [Penicillium thymicola]
MYDHSQLRTERRMGSFTARLSKTLAGESSKDSDSSGHPENDEAQDGVHDPVKKRHAVSEKVSQEASPGVYKCGQEVSDMYSTTGIIFMINVMTAGQFGE